MAVDTTGAARREDGSVNDRAEGGWAAPSGPPIPPPGTPGRSPAPDHDDPPPGTTPDDSDGPAGGWSWPFESPTEAAEWWLRPVIESKTWVAFAYLLVGGIAWPVAFALLVAAAGIAFGLGFVFIGLLLVPAVFALAEWFVGVERRRAGWVGEQIPPPTLATGTGGFWSSFRTCLTDPVRWRHIGFIASGVVVGPVFLALGWLLWGVVTRFLFAAGPGVAGVIGGIILAVLLSGAAARATPAVAKITHSYVRWFIGPDDAAILAERVEELSTQRQQILDAVDAERRRIERNLHDGVQQQLVAIGIDIARAQARVTDDPETATELLGEARDKLRGSIGELRLIGRGLHPSVLDDRGLDAALSSVVAGSSIPISVEVEARADLPDDVATTAYYVASEAVTNILKHSGARVASVRVDEVEGSELLRITVHDDGRGGADPTRGSGLVGMRARVEGLDGRFELLSPEGGPTTLVAALPLRGKNPTVHARTPDPDRPGDSDG